MTTFLQTLKTAATDLLYIMPAAIGIALVLGITVMTLNWWLQKRRQARTNL